MAKSRIQTVIEHTIPEHIQDWKAERSNRSVHRVGVEPFFKGPQVRLPLKEAEHRESLGLEPSKTQLGFLWPF